MISVIVPAYNAAKTLPACMAALLCQTQTPDEIIVVNDGSQDETIQAAQSFGVLVITQPHQGPAAARNLGIRQAHGDIVLFTDADCEPEPTWVTEMIQPLTDPQVMGVKGAYRTRQQEIMARLSQFEFEERYDHLEQFATIDFIDTYSAAFRITALQEVGGFDLAFPKADNEDVELSYRLASAGYRLVFNRQAIVYHRHPSTWRAYLYRKIKRGYWRMMVYRLYPGKAVRDTYTPQLLKAQIVLMYLILGLAGLSFFFTPIMWGTAAVLISLCLSAIPFIQQVVRRDSKLAVAALFFVIVRAFAFSVGVGIGLAGMLFFHPLPADVKKT